MNWARRHKRKFDAVISIEDKNKRFGLRFHRDPKPPQLILRFTDLDFAAPPPYDKEPHFALATQDDVEKAINFSAGKLNLLIHCQAGIARSTAIALAIILSRLGPNCEVQALDELLRISPYAVPNLHVVALTDKILNCNGKLVDLIRKWDGTIATNKERRALNRQAHFSFYGLKKDL